MQALPETKIQSHMLSIHSPHSTRKTIMKLRHTHDYDDDNDDNIDDEENDDDDDTDEWTCAWSRWSSIEAWRIRPSNTRGCKYNQSSNNDNNNNSNSSQYQTSNKLMGGVSPL